VQPAADPGDRTVGVYVEVDPAPASLAPGSFVGGTVLAGAPVERFVVPRRSLLAGRLWVVDAGDRVRSVRPEVAFMVSRRFERFGLADRQWAVLEPGSGLAVGDRVIINASTDVTEGQSVVVAGEGGSP
jgi:multidrug efflux pump subunit AcrA (membrane-fusion protein)